MRYLLLLLITLCAVVCYSQKAQLALEKLYKDYPQEKVVITYSKNEYVAGETMLFKAYVLNGYQRSTISTNLYVELYDKNKNIVDKQILPLFNGTGDGSFAIPASTAEDVYYLRAYTHWMLNFSERFQYVKPVLIYNPYSAKQLKPKQAQWTAKASIEGGQLLEGLSARIAVRLFADGNLPASWKAKLIDKTTGEVINEVNVYNNEIGDVWILPQPTKQYAITIQDTLGKTAEILLGQVKSTGIGFHSDINKNKLFYSIAFKGIPSNGVGYKLMGTMHEEIVFSATIQKSSGEVKGAIAIDSIPAGVLRLTLFDENEKPVLERLCFLHQDLPTETAIDLHTDTISFVAKERNAWHFSLDSTNWTSFTVQVNDGAYKPADNFLSDIYLSADFPTPIKQANWYFSNSSKEQKAALDALLLTETWERFSWTNLIQGNYPLIEKQPDVYLNYSGTVSGGRQIKPLRELNLLFQGKDFSIQFVQVKTDSSGTFHLNNLVFEDSLRVYYQPTKRGFFEPQLKIDFTRDNQFYPFKRDLPASAWTVVDRTKTDSVPWAVQKSVMQRNNERLYNDRSKMMEEVFVRTTVRTATQELEKRLSSSLFMTPNAMVFDFVNHDAVSALGYNNVLSWLQGRVPGYSVQNSGGTLVPVIRNQVAQVFVDEISVEADFLSSLSINDIAMVKIIRGNFVSSSSEGSIAIYTRKGDMNRTNRMPSLQTGTIAGYRQLLPFFSPDYSIASNRDTADDRLVLSRETVAQQDDDKIKMWIQFYNNSSARSFYVWITGFTKEGWPVSLLEELK